MLTNNNKNKVVVDVLKEKEENTLKEKIEKPRAKVKDIEKNQKEIN